jgi:hypothetical protein
MVGNGCISMISSFPISVIVIMGFFILFNMYRRKTIMKRMGVGADIGTGIFPCGNVTGGTSLKYYCMSCLLKVRVQNEKSRLLK